MKKQAFVLTLGVMLLAMVSLGVLISARAQGGELKAGDYRLSGPYTHKNLSIFLVHGKNVSRRKLF